jgi:molybdenum cofactor cytidylyltransferase
MMISPIGAIILAAGCGSRMGRIKPLLPLGKGTVIAHIVRSFRAADVKDITVVLGHGYDDIIPELQKKNLAWVVNEHYEQGMLSSIKKGIGVLGSRKGAFFIMPADIPLVRPSTLTDLTTTHKAHPEKVIYPVFVGQRGHPPLIPTRFREDILNYEGPGGLRRCLEAWDSDAREVAVADQGVLMDMDTPDDYAFILKRFKNLAIPSTQEALALLMIHHHGNPQVMAHAETVADVAAAIGRALNRTGSSVNVSLIEAAGMLHDIAKGQSDHAQKGADLIAAKGFTKVAEVVGQHMDLIFDPFEGIHAAEVVFLADKMVSGSEIVSLEKRLQGKKEQFAEDAEALKMMSFRMEQAIRIRQSIEKMIGEPFEKLFSKKQGFFD